MLQNTLVIGTKTTPLRVTVNKKKKQKINYIENWCGADFGEFW
jgi:hypothetical protein